jgi:hypothetical protein
VPVLSSLKRVECVSGLVHTIRTPWCGTGSRPIRDRRRADPRPRPGRHCRSPRRRCTSCGAQCCDTHGSIFLINPRTNQVIVTVHMAGIPTDLAVSHADDAAYLNVIGTNRAHTTKIFKITPGAQFHQGRAPRVGQQCRGRRQDHPVYRKRRECRHPARLNRAAPPAGACASRRQSRRSAPATRRSRSSCA